MDSTENEILLLFVLLLETLGNKIGDGGVDDGVEVTSTSTSESSDKSDSLASVLTTRGSWQSGWWVCCWMRCWWKGRTWKRIGCRAFQQGDGAGPSDGGGGVASPPHPGLMLKRWSSTAACCSRWNMTASKSRSAKAKRKCSKVNFVNFLRQIETLKFWPELFRTSPLTHPLA